VTIWQVRQIWAAFDFKRHRLRTFKTSNDPVFAEKVIDVVGLYLNPPNNAIVLSVDKKTQIQALDRTFFSGATCGMSTEGAKAFLSVCIKISKVTV